MAITINNNLLDIGKSIFPQFDLRKLKKSSLVCKLWYAIINSDDFWLKKATVLLNQANINIFNYPNCYPLFSEADLIQSVQKFANSTLFNQKGKFECLFPFDPACSVDLELGYGSIEANEPFDQHPIYVFMDSKPKGEPVTGDNSIVYGEAVQAILKYNLGFSSSEIPETLKNRLAVLESEHQNHFILNMKITALLLTMVVIIARVYG